MAFDAGAIRAVGGGRRVRWRGAVVELFVIRDDRRRLDHGMAEPVRSGQEIDRVPDARIEQDRVVRRAVVRTADRCGVVRAGIGRGHTHGRHVAHTGARVFAGVSVVDGDPHRWGGPSGFVADESRERDPHVVGGGIEHAGARVTRRDRARIALGDRGIPAIPQRGQCHGDTADPARIRRVPAGCGRGIVRERATWPKRLRQWLRCTKTARVIRVMPANWQSTDGYPNRSRSGDPGPGVSVYSFFLAYSLSRFRRNPNWSSPIDEQKRQRLKSRLSGSS